VSRPLVRASVLSARRWLPPFAVLVARWGPAGEWLAAGALALLLAARLAAPDPRIGDDDFGVFLAGARALAQGASPYVGDFVSPPWFALFLLPLTPLPDALARGVWLALNLLLLGTGTALAAGLVGLCWPPRRVLLAALLLAHWPPVEFGLRLGQNSLLAWGLGLLALAAAQRGRFAASGALLALAAIKPQLGWLVALGLVAWAARQGRAARLVGAGVLTLLLLAGAIALAAPASYVDLMALRPRPWNYWGSNIALPAALAALVGQGVWAWGLYALVALGGSAGVLAGWWRLRASLPALAAYTAGATLLLTPYAYPYDAVLLGLPLLALVARLRGWRPWTATLLLAALGIALVLLVRPADYTPSRFFALAAPPLVLAALALAACPAVSRRR
jgi:hypothetical protein